MEDSRIIALYFQRSEDAIAETAAKYGSYCYSIAYNILSSKGDAEETVNDTYMGAWKAIPPHDPKSLSAFLGKITRRIAINRWQAGRAAKRGGSEMTLALEELDGCIPSGQSPEQELEATELSRLLNRFVRGLPEPERRVFVLRYWYLNSIADVANLCGFSQSKVKSMLFRTRNKLRFLLEKEGIAV